MAVFDVLAGASESAASTSKRSTKVEVFAAALAAVPPSEVAFAVHTLTGTTRHGRLGVGWATISKVAALAGGDVAPSTPTLTIGEVADALDRLAAAEGSGVVAARRAILDELIGRATDRERRLLLGVLGGELRQGALDGVMASAIAKAAAVPVAAVRRAAMMAGDLASAAVAAMAGGEPALEAIGLTPLRPVQPMLASPVADIDDALGRSGGDAEAPLAPVAVEWKIDGARIQVHRVGDEVRVFTRNLNDITARVPHVVAVARSLPAHALVLDGEVLGLDPDGAPLPFQDTMSDFGTHTPRTPRSSVASGSSDADGAPGIADRIALRPYLFDALHVDGTALHDEPLAVRRAALADLVPPEARLPSIITADPEAAAAFLTAAVDAGHEGVMVKDLDQPYAAGRRGAAWRKVKPVYTFDLVVLGAEWGHGRRTGWLSNLHLGARATDAAGVDTGEWVMVGKTFKGLTDELLAWQTRRFTELEIGRERGVVHVRPEQVVEVAIDGVQRSSRYPGGVALRFARVRRYRHDKAAADADTIDRLRALLA